MKHQLQISLPILLLTSAVVATADVPRALTAIEQQTSWRRNGTVGASDAKTLSRRRLSDAAVFLEYGFSKHVRVGLAGPQASALTLDTYEMVDSVAAYGIFTYLRPSTAEPVEGIGNIGCATKDGIAFQQDRYYIVLTAPGIPGSSRYPLLQLATVVSKTLPKSSSLPLVAEKLPKNNLVPLSEKFLMGPEALSRLLPVITKDPFGLSTGAEAALAKYESSGETATLLLIYYPTQQLARKFLNAGYEEYSTRYPDKPIFYKRDGPMAIVVLESSSPELATLLLETVSYVSMVSWDPKVEPPSVAQVMLNIFMFCGVMLAITFVAGLGLGILRVVINRIFPGRVFDKPKNMEVIRLKLDSKG